MLLLVDLKKNIKVILKRIVPATFQKIDSAGEKYSRGILEKYNESGDELRDFVAKTQEDLSQMICENRQFAFQHNIKILNQMSAIEARLSELEQSMQQLSDVQNQLSVCKEEWLRLSKEHTSLAQNMMEKEDARACEHDSMQKTEAEILWAHIFNNTIQGSTWLTESSFSPGRWAMGYPELYVLYRVLDEIKPKSILELGLGQSTKMITQYVKEDCAVQHYVVEHDESWIDFYKNNNPVPVNTQIIHLEREYVPYKEDGQVRVFAGFKEAFSDKKFDFIVIDAPLGSDMKHYSRIDVLTLIPQSLKERFVIILDDAERSGEMNTIKEVDLLLKKNQIRFKRNFYCGAKKLCIWASPDWGFLCSM